MRQIAFEPMVQWEAPMPHQPVDCFAVHSLNPIDGFFEDAEFYCYVSHIAVETNHE